MRSERALNEKDLKSLRSREREIARYSTRQVRNTLIMSAVCVLGGAIITLTNHDALIPSIGTALCFIGIFLWVFLEGELKSRKELKEIRYLKAFNKVTSIRVQAQEYYQLTEEEDEGVHYIFQVEPTKILCFGGQEFYPTKKFPTSDFEIAEGRNKKGNVIFREIYCSGQKLKPLKKIKGKQKADLMKKLDFDGFEIKTGRLEKLIK